MAVSLKDLSKWLKEEVDFLIENEDYVGGWLQLGNGLAATVLWEPGYGLEARDDVIQSKENPDYALCAGILVYNPHDTPDGWHPLFDKEGDVVTETTSFTKDGIDGIAEWILDDFEKVKDVDYDKDGVIQDDIEESEHEEESLHEGAPTEGKDISYGIIYILDDDVSERGEIFDTEEEAREFAKSIDKEKFAGYMIVEIESHEEDGETIYDDDEIVVDSEYFDDDDEIVIESKRGPINRKKKVTESVGDSFHNSEYKDIIAEHFDHDWDFEFLDVVADIIDRIEDFDDDEAIYDAMDSGLIYTADQWAVIEHYCSPDNANFNDALDYLSNDLYAIVQEIKDSKAE